MANQEIRIVTLPPMRVASFYAFSSSPEVDAWNKLVPWAKAHAYWQVPPTSRIFGFNNPDPSAGSPNYGYEFWLTVDPDIDYDEQVRIKDFSGGMYAVLNCAVTFDTLDIIGTSWSRLIMWFETSHYKHGTHQWLEEHLSRSDLQAQGFDLDLYLPINE